MDDGGRTGFDRCCGCILLLIGLTLYALGIAKVVMGAIYFHDCSLEPKVPIWCIVAGCLLLLFGGFLKRLRQFRKSTFGRAEDNADKKSAIVGGIGFLIKLIWLILGSLWIYPTFNKINDDTMQPCNAAANVTSNCYDGDCDTRLINFSFAVVTIDWVCLLFWGFLAVCTICSVVRAR